MSLSNGVHFGVKRADYDALNRANWSNTKELARSPAHFVAKLRGQHKDTDPMRLGRATHIACLEPEKFLAEVCMWDGDRRAGNAWKEFEAAHKGQEILTENQWKKCLAIQAAVRNDPVAAPYLQGGSMEVTVLWDHRVEAVSGLAGYVLPCKLRLDFLGKLGPCIVDLKTTKNASPDGFGREVLNHDYHSQAATYVDGYAAATGERLPYLWIAVENEAPHVVQVYRATDEVLEMGRELYRANFDRLNVLLGGMHYGAWLTQLRAASAPPRLGGYVDGETDLVLPKWATPHNEDEDLEGLDLQIGAM